MSKLYVNEIHGKASNKKALEVDNNNLVKIPDRPRILVRGYNSTNSSTGVGSSYRYITSWQQTDYNVGNMLSSGTIVIPYTGLYQCNILLSQFSSSNHPNIAVWVNDTITYSNFSINDYDNKNLGFHQCREFTAGDVIKIGWHNSYASPNTQVDANYANFYWIG